MRYVVFCHQPLTANAGEFILIQDGVAVEVLASEPVPVPPIRTLEPPPSPPLPPPAQRIVPTEKDVLDFFKAHPDTSFTTAQVIRGLERHNMMTPEHTNRRKVSRIINMESRHVDGGLEIAPSLRVRFHAYRLRQKGA